MKEYKSVGIIGHLGMVGGTSHRYFTDAGYEVNGYDIRGTSEEERKRAYGSDLVFVCVPTPFNWKKNKYDDSAVMAVLKQVPDESTVVIKSTVQIGTTDKLQKRFKNLKLLFNPEFLSEATCDSDFRNPDRQVVGYTKESYKEAIRVLNTLPLSSYDVIVPAKEAELIKYMNNLHGMVEIMESNHYFEVCEKEGLDYDRVTRAAIAAKWVGVPMGRHYRVVKHRGYRGFGGKCFPKDINAWIEYCSKRGIDPTLMEAVRRMNRRILEEQRISEEGAERI